MDRVWLLKYTHQEDGQLKYSMPSSKYQVGYIVDAHPCGPEGLGQELLVLPVLFSTETATAHSEEAAASLDVEGSPGSGEGTATRVKAVIGVPVVVRQDCSGLTPQAFLCAQAAVTTLEQRSNVLASVRDCVHQYVEGCWPIALPPIPAEWQHQATLGNAGSDGACE